MALIENIVDIARDPAEVFDYLADQSNELDWNPDCVSMEKLTDGPVGVGTRFRAKWKQGPVVFTEVREFDRPVRWVYANGGAITCVLTVTLASTRNGSTQLVSRGEWGATGWMRIVFPIFMVVMRRAEIQTLANAKRALEEGRDRALSAVA